MSPAVSVEKKTGNGELRIIYVYIIVYTYTYIYIYIILYTHSIHISSYIIIYISIYLSIYLSIHPSIHPSISLSVCLYLSTYLPTYLSIYRSICIIYTYNTDTSIHRHHFVYMYIYIHTCFAWFGHFFMPSKWSCFPLLEMATCEAWRHVFLLKWLCSVIPFGRLPHLAFTNKYCKWLQVYLCLCVCLSLPIPLFPYFPISLFLTYLPIYLSTNLPTIYLLYCNL